MIKYKAKNSLKSPRFAGVKTFMRMEHVVTTDDIDFAVVGIPYDTCASFRVGTRLGPAAIRDASALAAKPFNGPLNVGIFDWCSGVDYGDLGSVPGYIEESFELITEGMLPFFEKGIVPVVTAPKSNILFMLGSVMYQSSYHLFLIPSRAPAS